MKKFIHLLILLTPIFISLERINATNGNSFCDPDSLELVTVTGTVIVDTVANQVIYFLDVDGNDTADYRLNFGPFWYAPPESSLTLPIEGATIVIYGGLNLTAPVIPVIVVYEIDGEFWRNPFEPFWNNFNQNYLADKSHGNHNQAPGWLQDSLLWDTLSGIVIIDSTFIYLKYYLDIDTDGIPDYKLNFGPPWYEPLSGVTIPSEGDFVEVYGIDVPLSPQNVFIVFEINGETWRESDGFGVNSFGRWMNGNMNQIQTTHEPFNMQNQIRFQNGWHGQGLPANMFCQLLQTHFQNFPNYQNQNGFAGFEVGCFTQMGMGPINNLMMQNGQKLRFNNEATLQLHINQKQIDRAAIQQRDRIRLKYYNEDTQSWENADAQLDLDNNLVVLESATLYSYYMLVLEEETTALTDMVSKKSFAVRAYPNPAIDYISINFDLEHHSLVYLSIYDQLGREITRIINGERLVGHNRREIQISDRMRDGIYYLRFSADGIGSSYGIQIIR